MFKIAYTSRVFLGHAACNLGAAIRGTVIDEQQFPVGIGLCKYTFDGFFQELPLVQKNDDSGDEGRRFGRHLHRCRNLFLEIEDVFDAVLSVGFQGLLDVA